MKSNRYLNRHGLTFACLYALDPRMIKVSVAGVSAALEPSTAASATTESAGFLGIAALGTHFIDAYHGCRCHRDCFCEHVRVV